MKQFSTSGVYSTETLTGKLNLRFCKTVSFKIKKIKFNRFFWHFGNADIIDRYDAADNTSKKVCKFCLWIIWDKEKTKT